MGMPGGAQVLQRWEGVVQRMQKPVIRYVESSRARLETAVASCTARDRAAFFPYCFEQALDQQHQSLACAQAQTCGNEVLVIDQVPTAVPENVSNGNGKHIVGQLSFRHQPDIFLA